MNSKKRLRAPRILQFLPLALLFAWPPSARAQTVVTSIPTGIDFDIALAINPATNMIYVAGRGSGSGPCTWNPGNVAVVEEATASATLIDPGAVSPRALAVNPVTNKIYVADYGDIEPLGCGTNPGKVTVLDGATNTTTEIIDPNAVGPIGIAVNPTSNRIYVANWLSGNVTVIDGTTNATTTLTDPNAAFPFAVAVNSTTNKIYVANQGSLVVLGTNSGNVTVIDGTTNAITTVADPNAFVPDSLAVNLVTNKIYVANQGSLLHNGTNPGNATVIDGETNTTTTITDLNAITPGGGDSRGFGVAVNSTTNKIYVVNEFSHNVTVIDGASNAVTTVTDSNARAPVAVAVDSATNKIYVANMGNDAGIGDNVTVIDGATNFTTTVTDAKAKAPDAVVINPATNKIYVANYLTGNITVLDGGVTPTSFTLSVTLAGNGSGTVTSNPAGLNCGNSCSASFAPGATVSLTASPASGSTFSGWSGPCSGMGTCNLTMNADESVTSTFDAGPPPDFSLQPASANLTAQRGGQVTDVITIAPQNGSFGSAIQLACTVSGSTPTATCALSPNSVTPGTNSATSTLTVTAPAQTAGLIPFGEGQVSSPLYGVFLPIPLALIACSLMSGKPKERRRQFWLVCSLFLASAAVLAGCGGGSGNQLTPPPLNYTVTVTATSGAIRHTTQVTVIVP